MTDEKTNIQEQDLQLSEQDEKMLEMFFSQQRDEIQDHGFTRRVMRQLPARTNRLNLLWTFFCVAAGIIFFVAINGWQVLSNALTVSVRTVPAQDIFQLTPLTIFIGLTVLSIAMLWSRVETELR